MDDLRLFSEVFGRIKSDYVEPVEDRKLLKEAINGMLTGLDPHSAFLDQEAYRDLQVGTQGEFGGLGIEVGTEDGFVKVVAPIEDTPAYPRRRQGGRPHHQARRSLAEGHLALRRREEDARQAQHRGEAHGRCARARRSRSSSR